MKSLFRFVLSLIFVTFSSCLYADNFGFSMGGGYPFYAEPELHYQTETESIWYVNYKIGSDRGLSIGYEQAIAEMNKHALGAMIGSIGIHKPESKCPVIPRANQEQWANCIANSIFDDEAVYGGALTYSYSFSGYIRKGFSTRLSLGYGKSKHSKTKSMEGTISIKYRF